jgi:hypothetical protein
MHASQNLPQGRMLTATGNMQVSLILFTAIFDEYVAGFEKVLVEPQFAMVGILMAFAAVHSGLAFLRPYGATPLLACAASETDMFVDPHCLLMS